MTTRDLERRLAAQRDRVDQAYTRFSAELNALLQLAGSAAPPPGPRLLYTMSQAGEVLGFSERTIYRLVDEGQLASVMIGRSRRIRADDLQDYVATLQPAAPPICVGTTPIQLAGRGGSCSDDH